MRLLVFAAAFCVTLGLCAGYAFGHREAAHRYALRARHHHVHNRSHTGMKYVRASLCAPVMTGMCADPGTHYGGRP